MAGQLFLSYENFYRCLTMKEQSFLIKCDANVKVLFRPYSIDNKDVYYSISMKRFPSLRFTIQQDFTTEARLEYVEFK